MRVAVVGAGVVGLSTARALLARGADVTCYESVAPMSQRSAGASRIFRLAHGLPELVELAAAAGRAYRTWSQAYGRPLVGGGGTVVSGPDVPHWAAAMSAAGAPHHVEDDPRRTGLPLRSIPGPVLVDESGGVVDAQGTGEFLLSRLAPFVVTDTVLRIEQHGGGARLWTAGGGRADVDVCVLAAGAATGPLAAQVGLETPGALLHHVRFTFELAAPAARPPSVIDKTEAWRPGVTTYQHLSAPGRWAVGAHFDPAACAWDLGRERVTEASRRLTVDYVRENLDGVGDRIVDELYCAVTVGWGDGYGVQRSGAVLALYGDNLFKLAPALGELLAEAAFTGGSPTSVLDPSAAHPSEVR